MQITSTYTVARFAPATPIPLHLLQRFKALRLDALMSASASFVSNYKHEHTFTDIEWANRIKDSFRHHFICIKLCHTESGSKDRQPLDLASDEVEWVGMFTLRGPLTREQYDIVHGRKGPPLGNDSEETRWHLVGLYLKSEDRGNEAAIAIHEAILDYLRTRTDELLETVLDARTGLEKPTRARVAGSRPSQDSLLTELYTSLGACEVGWVGRNEAFQIAGNPELLKMREDEEDMGSIPFMERVVAN